MTELQQHKDTYRIESFTIPDGEYYVGCPCLVLPEDKWEWWCEQDDQCFEFDGHKVISISTGGDGYWYLFEKNEDGTAEDEDGNQIKGPVHVDSLPTDVASMSIIPMELLESLGCDRDEVADCGHIFDVWSFPEDEKDAVFDVEFKYKMYEEFKDEQLSHVDFLWFKLNVTCQWMEDNDED